MYTDTIQKYKQNTNKIQTQYKNTNNTQISIYSLYILLSETESLALFIFSAKDFDVQDFQFHVSMEITV